MAGRRTVLSEGPARGPSQARGLGVLGGTFDPVHKGHLAIASAALRSLRLDRVLFVLARRSPLKKEGPVASAEDRLRMLELAVADEPRFAVSRIELDRPGPSYTIDTLEALARSPVPEHGDRGPDLGRLHLILGADAAADLHRWKDPDRIRELATIVVARRPGAPEAIPAGAIALDAPLVDISARDLRAKAARGESLRYRVPDAVWRYIEERGLYRRVPPGGSTDPSAGS
jgi:nicotinate-nucleotide adenylyltransferase